MNKSQFNKYVRESLTKRYRNSKIEDANELIEIFVESRIGRNPRTGEPIKIKSYNQVKFKPGLKLKESCNKIKKPKK